MMGDQVYKFHFITARFLTGKPSSSSAPSFALSKVKRRAIAAAQVQTIRDSIADVEKMSHAM
jgi:hypothetical protein